MAICASYKIAKTEWTTVGFQSLVTTARYLMLDNFKIGIVIAKAGYRFGKLPDKLHYFGYEQRSIVLLMLVLELLQAGTKHRLVVGSKYL
ncbi:hypothetical protein CU097_010562 [Rhizopus azygosporus]|uniref:Uncharacterized protein n=1 Tax=Rhizopus azygosporus TaxID=86630 RepID=A0A367JSY5_RHIAZ|nr:hypothetical protein CU097_010562 [Rhizopus azygosporus]